LLIVFGFTFFISDIRKKEGMQNFFDKRVLLLVKLLYPILLTGYLYILVALERVLFFDWVGFFLTSAAFLLVWRAKRDLGKAHTWAGHFLEKPILVTSGVYAYTRNPMYTAIYLFMAGAFFTVVSHASVFLTVIMSLAVLGIAVFLAIAARKEAQLLREIFKEKFISYEQHVSAFFLVPKLRRDKPREI
jgi:protein-S-isoprenylcysteine O-methyltransferase Ste14